MKQALLPVLGQALFLGFAAGASQVDVMVESGLLSADAYAEKKAQDINATTQKMLLQGYSLKEALSDARAETIGTTEVTDLFYRGEETAWKRSKVVDMLVWVTASDERTCPICASLHGKTTILGMPFPGGYFPPQHANCACIAMVLKVGKNYL